jgi:hypothetical protein
MFKGISNVTSQELVLALQGIAAFVVIVGGLLTIYIQHEVRPESPNRIVHFAIVGSPYLLNLGGLAAIFIWNLTAVSIALIASSFFIEIVTLISAPIDRRAVAWFSVDCCIFVICVGFIFLAQLANIFGDATNDFQSLKELFGKLI